MSDPHQAGIDPFTYIPPNEITAPKHEAIREAYNAAVRSLPGLVETRDFGGISRVCRAFYEAIREHAPPSADRSAAERCVRLGRMLANEAIATCDNSLIEQAISQLRLARMQASAAVALYS
jgi:hypothetical protein